MNLLHMTYFIAVVEHESISGAAQSLFITQQTLSSHVAAMEKELGASLFDRRPKFRLTQAGEIFYRYCIRFRDLNDAMVSEFRDLSGEVSDILHVGISQTRSRILMPSHSSGTLKLRPYSRSSSGRVILLSPESLLSGQNGTVIVFGPGGRPASFVFLILRFHCPSRLIHLSLTS